MSLATPPSNRFDTLPLSAAAQDNLRRLGYLEMTAIQAASLPAALQGRDLIAQAKTGSGKTAAFALALLAKLNLRRFAVQALVLCPTRELADQVSTEVRRLARAEDNIKVVTLVGGVPLRGQTSSLEHGAHVVVGTPGRVIDHLERGHLSLDALATLVLDEADRMLDMGFADDIATIARQCPVQRQTLLFSATYPEGIARLAAQFLRDPVTVKVQAQHGSEQIEQRWYEVREDQRLQAVASALAHFRPSSTLAFCNTKVRCRELVGLLQAQGLSALALHGDLEQRERDQVLVRFANASCSVLVATDVAARGLDVAGLAAVINADISPDPQAHVHRIGRTGRAGAAGKAIAFCEPAERPALKAIERLTGKAVPVMALPQDLAALGSIEPERAGGEKPAPRAGGRRGGGRAAGRTGQGGGATTQPTAKRKGPAHGRGGAHAKAAKAQGAAAAAPGRVPHPAAGAPAPHPRAHQLPSARTPSRRGRR